MTLEQLNELEQKAGAATKGSWGCGIRYVSLGDDVVQDWAVHADGVDIAVVAGMEGKQKEKNAIYIAASNPATVKALIGTIKKMAIDTARWQATHTSLSCNVTADDILERAENIITQALLEAGE